MDEKPPNDLLIERLRFHLKELFVSMDEVGEYFHPWVEGEAKSMAELLGINEDAVPTEGRAFARRHQSQA